MTLVYFFILFFFCTGAVFTQYPSKKKSRRPIKHPFIPDKEDNVTTREVKLGFCYKSPFSRKRQPVSFSLFRGYPLKRTPQRFVFMKAFYGP